jgi:hypothetical protein
MTISTGARRRRSTVVAFAVTLFAFGVVCASGEDIRLPLETAVLAPSTLPGYALAQQRCGMCHSFDYIAQQPPRMSAAQWSAEVTKMRVAYGASVVDEEIAPLAEYLAAISSQAP